ncbi:glutaredoxin domain-containing protein [Nocardia takedensis]|uniref:glutaredoxin domain-containing protein n=1 Tax=Nocardia takedensis TaxID=259390 RepID=UPI00031016B3|nr:glutaredoxin domain-containing protein [Nocardia takedensis]
MTAPVLIELYMHGTPGRPLTAYSLLAVWMLSLHSIDYTAHDITIDHHALTRVRTLSGVEYWPQLVIDGEYIGGTEVLTELLRTRRLSRRQAS